MAEKKVTQAGEEKVKFTLFKDNGKYSDDLTVGLNGKFYKIQRGVIVEAPKAVYQIIQQSLEQDAKTAQLISYHEKHSEKLGDL